MSLNAQLSQHHFSVVPSLVVNGGSELHKKEPQASLYELYSDMFEGIIANTDALIDECYRLRYKVYCVEHPFEDPNPLLGEYERDTYDGHSIHALLRHRESGEFIGTVRLIIDQPDSPCRMPVVQICEENRIILPKELYSQQCGEISRFCISKEFRRRVTDSMYSTSYSARELATVRNRVIPFMALGLMKMVFEMYKLHGMHSCFAVMEPSLIRLLDKLGIHFTSIGNPIEHHGIRQVAWLSHRDLYHSLVKERPDVLELMTDQGRSPLNY